MPYGPLPPCCCSFAGREGQALLKLTRQDFTTDAAAIDQQLLTAATQLQLDFHNDIYYKARRIAWDREGRHHSLKLPQVPAFCPVVSAHHRAVLRHGCTRACM